MRSSERKLTLTAGWLLMAVAVWPLDHHPVLAGDKCSKCDHASTPACLPEQPGATAQAGSGGLPFVPFFDQFLVVTADGKIKPADFGCQEIIQRIGVDFDWLPAGMGVLCARGELPDPCCECTAAVANPCASDSQFARSRAECCPQCAAAECLEGTVECQAAGPCGLGEACPFAGQQHVHALGVKPCAQTQEASCCDSTDAGTAGCGELAKLRERVEELIFENAGLLAAQHYNAELFALGRKMEESQMQLIREKIELQCRLEMTEKLAAEREKSLRQSMELAAENRQLKSANEFAQAQHERELAQMQVALENERLKQRVAELERLAVEPRDGVRTAKKATGTKLD